MLILTSNPPHLLYKSIMPNNPNYLHSKNMPKYLLVSIYIYIYYVYDKSICDDGFIDGYACAIERLLGIII